MSARHGTPITARVVEYRGHELEVAGELGDVAVTLDGRELVRTRDGERDPFLTVEHALEYARRRVDLAERPAEPERRLGFSVDWWEREGYEARWLARFADVELEHQEVSS